MTLADRQTAVVPTPGHVAAFSGDGRALIQYRAAGSVTIVPLGG